MINIHCIECGIQKRDKKHWRKISDGRFGEVETKDLNNGDELCQSCATRRWRHCKVCAHRTPTKLTLVTVLYVYMML
jgi:hypothetical protein